MDEDPSINDILDADDDHENWSDFSIEEELPSNFREEERYNNNSSSVGKNKQLCQENCSTAETLEMTEILIKTLLDEVIDKVFEYQSEISDEVFEDFQEEIRILPAITVAQDTCHDLNTEAFEVQILKNDLNNNIVEDFANALASEVIHETLNEAKDMQEMEDEDELFLVLHPPQHESGTKIFQLCYNFQQQLS